MNENTNIAIMQEDNQFSPNESQDQFWGSTFEIISKVAYLIGVPKNKFEEDNSSPKLNVYEKIDKDKNARIIRDLCMLRTAVERNFKNIFEAMKFDYKTIMSMPEYVPVEALKRLHAEGVYFSLHKITGENLTQLIIEINKNINNRINNCKSLFPIWLNWSYIKELFIMPDGLTESGAKSAAEVYYQSRNLYGRRNSSYG